MIRSAIPSELLIDAAAEEIRALPAAPLLSEALDHLGRARGCVGRFVDGPDRDDIVIGAPAPSRAREAA